MFDYGDKILGSGQSSDSIMILWQGFISVRVVRFNTETEQMDDYWLDTLEKGACFSVYNAFAPDWHSLVTYKASAKNTIILKMNVAELQALGVNNLTIKDKVDIAKLRVINHEVDEIDYFTFPKKYLEVMLVNQSRQDMVKMRQHLAKQKKIMVREIIHYTNHVREGKANIPKPLDMLLQIKVDREELMLDIAKLDRL
jgi:hypothetical protein